MPESILEVARGFLRQRRWSPIPVPHRTKSPVLDKWQKMRLTEEQLPLHFNGHRQNIGVLLGEPSDWLVDVDLDCPETVALAPRLLPATLAFGRTSKRRSHLLYRAPNARTAKLQDLPEPDLDQSGAQKLDDEGKPKFKRQTLVELRSTGLQTVFPPSIHVSGEPIEWEPGPDALLELGAEQLRAAVNVLGVAALLERHCPDLVEAFIAAPADVPPETPADVAALARKWLGVREPKARRPTPPARAGSFEPDDEAERATAAFNAEHPPTWTRNGGPCPVCDGKNSFKALPGDPTKWVCFHATHQGCGTETDKGCWVGDALDLAAWAEHRSPIEHLLALGRLKPRARREEPPPPGDELAPSRRLGRAEIEARRAASPAPAVGGVASAAALPESAPDGRPDAPPPDEEWIPPAGLEEDPRPEPPSGRVEPRYEARPGGLIWWKPVDETHCQAIALTNFDAEISADVIEDDGVETKRLFEIAANVSGRKSKVTVQAGQFAALGWVIEGLGPRAIINPGNSLRDHVRAAIQFLSSDIESRTVYTHLGWREIDGRWFYLHANGAIGDEGALTDVFVQPAAELRRYALPAPPDGAKLVEAVRASLSFLNLAPHRITVPAYAAIPRAAMSSADFSVGLVGRTGTRKSALAACAQQHWGPEMDGRHLPAAWSSTENALEGLAFAAKDAMLVIDDFAPTGSQLNVQQLHAKAERILRAQGNQSARSRMRADSSLRAGKPPRGLILWTAEDVPRGESVRARSLIVELVDGDLNLERLTEFQRAAADGLPAQALAGFLRWFASRRTAFLTALPEHIAKMRSTFAGAKGHGRTSETITHLLLGLRYWLAFAKEIGAIEAPAAADLEDVARESLLAGGEKQTRAQAASEPTRRFLELLGAALGSGAAHVASPIGRQPDDGPERWGWRLQNVGATGAEWRPQGARVGWTDGDDLYLDMVAAMGAAERMGRDGAGEGLCIGPVTLRKRLAERGLLASTDDVRETLSVRRVLEGQKRTVVHLKAEALFAEEGA